MPVTAARPPDIAFDHAAAADAVAALSRARAVLSDTMGSRHRAVVRAGHQFRGTYADDFATAERAISTTTDEAHRALAGLQAEIEAAVDAARTAQAARGIEQRTWDDARAATPVGVA